jgi:hypothetical protein
LPSIPVAVNDVGAKGLPAGGLAPGDYGSGIGKGLEALGQGLDQASDAKLQIDEGAAKQLDNQFTAAADSIVRSGPDAFLSKAGGDAVATHDATVQKLRDLASSTLDGAKSPLQRGMLAQVVNQRLEQNLTDVGAHANQQGKVYNIDQTDSRAKLAFSTASGSFTNPDEIDKNIETGKEEVARLGALKGASPESVQLDQQTAVSKTRLNVVQSLAQQGPDGPKTASAYAAKYDGDLTADDRQAASAWVQTHQNAIDADVRRQAAEAREAESRAKTQARQEAETGMALAEIGPVPPAQMANIVTAAQQSGDESLILRAGMVVKKNQTRQVYQNFTPIELQSHINELAAKVTNDGDKADPSDIVQLNTMREMQGKSASEIGADPLSWAAQHLGINSGPVNWNDQASIAGRVHAAQLVTARTGAPVKPLLSTEAAQMAPTWATGTAQEKVGLVQRLAKLGPMGTAAAEQVAPHDVMLPGLVGLASIPDPAVASAMVHTVMAGPEAIKAHKDLVNGPGVPALIDSTYGAATGSALRLMPNTDAAVRAISLNYYAAKMASQGVYQFDAKQYPTAVSAALGGYRDHGIMRGGIGTSNGSQTVLPVGTTQDEFDAKIARMHAGAGQIAGNGIPQWSDGSTLTIGDMKRSQYVPVGDGRYALFANGNFVQRKGGGRYELDWRKIP